MADEERGGAGEDKAGISRRSGMAYAAGLAIFFSVLAFLGFGWMLDRWLGTAPWCLIGGILLGSAVGFYEFIKIMSRAE